MSIKRLFVSGPGSMPNAKSELMRLCARIGFTPPVGPCLD